MKAFYRTNYRIYNSHFGLFKSSLHLLHLSDIHFSHHVSDDVLQNVVKKSTEEKTEYILITGDIINTLDDIDNDDKLNRLTAWLQQLGNIAPTLLCLGNHDFYRKPPKGQKGWIIEQPTRFTEAIKPLKNVTLLNNELYSDKNLFVFGLTLPPEYYAFDGDASYSRPEKESKTALINLLDQFAKDHILPKTPQNKPRILLMHSPVYTGESEVLSYLKDFDLILTGHMHNGVVPPILQDFWHSDRGLVAPGKGTLPRRSRNTLKNSADKTIITGAITTMQGGKGKILSKLNGFFPVYYAKIELTKDKTFQRKPSVSCKYIKFMS